MEQLKNRLIRALKQHGLVEEDRDLDADTPLVSSGLIDSFGLVEILQILEDLAGRTIPSGQVSPQDLDTVQSMIRLVERLEEAG